MFQKIKKEYTIIVIEQWIQIVSVQIIIMWWIEHTITNIIEDPYIGLGILEQFLQWLVFSLFLIIHLMFLVPSMIAGILFIF
jgi:hypothetical protein